MSKGSQFCALKRKSSNISNRISKERKFVTKRFKRIQCPNLQTYKLDNIGTISISNKSKRIIDHNFKQNLKKLQIKNINIEKVSNNIKLGCLLDNNKSYTEQIDISLKNIKRLIQEYYFYIKK